MSTKSGFKTRVFRLAIVVNSAAALAGCAVRPGSNQPVALYPYMSLPHGSATLLPAGDYHLISTRYRPGDGDVPVFCSEPSPDWAVAFGKAVSGTASGGVTGGASGSLSGSYATTEAVTAMLGRTAGVVALRDGLYSACQAYVNKVIGKDAYSLILSQFGNLLVAVANGSTGPASAPAGAGGASTPAGVAVAVTAGGVGATPTKPASDANSSGSQVATMQQEAIQALLVACISESDPSLHPNPGDKNTLLESYCPSFMNALLKALPNLLKPPTAASVATASASAVYKPGQKNKAERKLKRG